MTAWTTRDERVPVQIDALVQRTDGREASVRVSNFSEHGCRLEGDNFRIGERLQIAVPQLGKLTAQVRWALPGAAGMRFLTESDF